MQVKQSGFGKLIQIKGTIEIPRGHERKLESKAVYKAKTLNFIFQVFPYSNLWILGYRLFIVNSFSLFYE